MHGLSRSSASSSNSFVRPRPDPQAVGASWLWAGHAMHALGRAEGGLSYHPNGLFGVGASAARPSRGASPAVLVPQLEGTRLDHEDDLSAEDGGQTRGSDNNSAHSGRARMAPTGGLTPTGG